MASWTLALAAAIVLAAIYPLGARLRAKSAALWARRRWLSLSAGVSISYVFLDVLPELATRQSAFLAATSGSPCFPERRIYAIALLAFVVVFGLEQIVLPARQRTRLEPRGKTDWIYVLHVGGFAAYSALIGYLCMERATDGIRPLLLYAAAMALHFFVVDNSLEEAHGHAYARGGRWLLSACVLAGWFAAFASELPVRIVDRLFGALAGGVVITSLRGELPSEERGGRFWAFVLGAAGYALLLVLA